MDEKYQAAVAALRETLSEYEDDSQVVAASAADIFVNELDKEDSFLLGVDQNHAARSLFMASTAMVLVRDQMVRDLQHLVDVDDGEQCTEESCTYTHQDLDFERLTAILDGFDVGVAAMVGMATAMADLAEGSDPDTFNWDNLQKEH